MQFIKFEGKEGVFLEKQEAITMSMLVGLAGLAVLPFPEPRNTILQFLTMVKRFYESKKEFVPTPPGPCRICSFCGHVLRFDGVCTYCRVGL